MSDPWLKFYATDWRADPALKMCSLAARGLWIELICLMHEATPYGHLLVNGLRPTDVQVAVLVGAPPDQIAALLGELEAVGVFSRTKDGTIYSRKLTRMAKKAAIARKNGRLGGNPSLGKPEDNPPSDNPPVNAGDKPQKPEARSKRLPDANASGTASGAPVDFTKEVFDRGVAFLGRYGTPDRRARELVGMWRKQAGDTETFNALRDAAREGITEPVAWITARLKAKPAQPDIDALMAQVMGGTK